MLFNSYIFIFLFLPVTLLGFHLLGGRSLPRLTMLWLVTASLFFYGWWNPSYLVLIIGSMLFNYAAGCLLRRHRRRGLLALGVGGNLALLAYYKYANFFVDNLNALAGSDLHLESIILPLAISFFTFQQIAYLVDTFRGETEQHTFLHYALFVTFFPQLIAGPIVHHREMLPQFLRGFLGRLKAEHLAIGFTIFVLGLFKKTVLADSVALHATPVFNAAEAGVTISFLEAWSGALAYTLQLYFDFSGYSDMAIGLARMFGLRLPLNFNSPYKATSIIDFWRRWHITLSRFLRDYLYIPLGGSRRGELRRNVNLLITMLLGGLWHGAGWTFVLWGGLHGLYLLINHGWRKLFPNPRAGRIRSLLGWGLTMLAVVVSWVPFRAGSLDGAAQMLAGMAGMNTFSPSVTLMREINEALPWIVLLVIIVLFLPNTQQIMRNYNPAFETYRGEISPLRYRFLEWKPRRALAIFLAFLFFISLLCLARPSEFLYFQF
jgi:alginate O-acetyltransferase complex protein AlgI